VVNHLPLTLLETEDTRHDQRKYAMSKILVTGAAGQLGKAVIQHLLDTYKVPAADIVAASRDTSKLADLAAKGVETRKADFDDEASLATAFFPASTSC
jgi:NAD(P)H dehydrogenase (quinone)